MPCIIMEIGERSQNNQINSKIHQPTKIMEKNCKKEQYCFLPVKTADNKHCFKIYVIHYRLTDKNVEIGK